jgi:hypothetical protein
VKQLVSITLYFSLAVIARSQDHAAPFTLAIVPSASTSDEQRITSGAKQAGTFYVVLTNTSDRPQPVWETSNSWGFWTISFDFRLPDGTHIHTSRNRKEAFTVNYPRTFVVLPRQQQIYPIQLDTTWDDRPQFPKAGSTHVTLKAIYEVGSTPEALQQNVWVGRVESPSYDLILDHW